ncbi:quinol monooxygenase YgiN [Cricetibacter osteomyelitidis]|uniref:Quinol monooxygenase YgiN n=1 Tax=Cricetibacter osteomyelitidis TaxID=1521931 RepID=A0A4V2T146_9PAST|nr:antibiotic biosynthesis monooxygenase [Cricetibacter osteomyelitidis]TCP92173.1 quinol monooxygenase YgiN [Cricetibacter osteomyelitidis]
MTPLKTLTAAAALTLSLAAHAAPVFNLFELGVQPSQAARYNQIGEHNIRTSVTDEAGTLAMYSVKGKEFNYMAEIYADEAAYQKHLKSPQYKAFLTASPQILTEHKKKIELLPQFLGDKKVEQTADTLTNLVIVNVKPEHNQAFARIVRDEMVQSLNVEDGVRAIYAATAKEEPNRWYFFEIYASEPAYQQHRQTLHFQSYLKETAVMLQAKKAVNIIPQTLMNKGGLAFDNVK